MAIKRCPYCRALIDEKDQYCNNCGTQLLFPEDGSVEEEIPGEKIIDADVEEKDYEIPEPGVKEEAPEPEDDGKDDEGAEPGEVVLVDEISALEKTPEPDTKTPESITPPEAEKKEPEKAGPEDVVPAPVPEAEESRPPEEEKREEAIVAPPAVTPETIPPVEPVAEEKADEATEPEAEEEALAEKKPMTFDTRDLDKIGRTAELGKEQIEKFLDALKAGAGDKEEMKIAAGEADEGLPPWASVMKEGPVDAGRAEEDAGISEEDAGDRELEAMESAEQEDILEEEVVEERPTPRVADSGMGLPEKVTQAPLPFERPIPRDGAAVEAPRAPARKEWPLREDEEGKEEEEEIAAERPRPPFKLSVFLKAKSFDVLFVAVFWLISLWLAARSMDVTLFQMIGAASTGLFVFLGILLGLYFFLFCFFLGETLGDRLFRDED